MRTVYESERAKVIAGDARDVLASIETESVDLVVADPPYGVEWQSRRRAEAFEMLANDGAGDREGVRAVLRECVRISRRERHLYVFGPSDVLEGLKVSRPVTLIWDKLLNGSGDLTAPWAPNHEPISFVVNKSDKGTHDPKNPVPARLRKGAIIRARRPNSGQVRHPSEKPLPLVAELIESSSRAGELIVDPFAGSGSTGVAAILRGRRALLIDCDDGWCRMARERVIAAERIAEQAAAL